MKYDNGHDPFSYKYKRPGKKSRINYIFLAVFIVIILILTAFILIKPRDLVGEQAPDFSLSDIDGNEFNLSDYRGKVVVLDLMATWCGPCKTEMDHLKTIFNKYNSSEVIIISIGIDSDESNEELQAFKEDYGDDWIFARDTDNVGGKYNADAIPTIVIIDKNGRVAFEQVGVTSSSLLIEEIDKLL